MTKIFRFIGILIYFSFPIFSAAYNEDLKLKKSISFTFLYSLGILTDLNRFHTNLFRCRKITSKPIVQIVGLSLPKKLLA